MRVLLALALVATVVGMAGCARGEKPTAEEIKLFEPAIQEYSKTHSIEAEPREFERIEIEGNQATVKVLMHREGDIYGMTRWVFHCQREGGKWVVVKVETIR